MIDAKERYEYLKAIFRNLTNVPEIAWNSRKSPYPTLRSLIWYQMKLDGYTFYQIADASGFTHCTIVTQSNKMKEIITSNNPSWRKVINLWKRFKLALAANPQPETNQDLSLRAAIIREILDLPKEERQELLRELRHELQNKENDTEEQVPQ